MYGLVNKAVRDLVVANHGEETWEAIRQKAGVPMESFVKMEPYPDDITYRLVGAASEVLGAPPEAILEAFGRYWVMFTAEEGYGMLLEMCGDNLRDFLVNLDTLHARVGLTYKKLAPPSFRCDEEEDGSLRIHYWSTRPGLGPMVGGLLQGLSERFNEPAAIEHVVRPGEGGDHDEFIVRILAA